MPAQAAPSDKGENASPRPNGEVHMTRFKTFVACALVVSAVAPAAAEWSAPLLLDEDVWGDRAVAASPGPDGSIVFVWNTGEALVTQVRAANGTLGPIETLAAGGVGVKVAMDADGNALFAWLDRGRRVWARARSAAGVLGPAERISGEDAADLRVGMTPGGDAVVAWRRAVPDTSPVEYRVQMRARSAAGAWTIARTLRSGLVAALDLAVDPAGNAVAVWEEGDATRHLSRIFARVRAADGTLGDVHVVSSWRAAEPRVAAAADGTMVFAWSRKRGDFFVIETRALSAAGVLGEMDQLSVVPDDAFVDRAHSPDVGVAADGTAVYGWLRHHDTPLFQMKDSVHIRVRAADGRLGPLQTFVTGTSLSFSRASIAVAPDGSAVFVWRRETTSRVEAGFRSADGLLRTAGLLSNANGSPDVAMDASGNAVLLYAYGMSGSDLVAHFGP